MARTPSPPPSYRCAYCDGTGHREVPPDLAPTYEALDPGPEGTPLETIRQRLDVTPTLAQNQLQRLMNLGAVTRFQGPDNRCLYTRNAGPEATTTSNTKRRSA